MKMLNSRMLFVQNISMQSTLKIDTFLGGRLWHLWIQMVHAKMGSRVWVILPGIKRMRVRGSLIRPK